MKERKAGKTPLPAGEYKDAFMYEDDDGSCDVLFTGKSDGKRHTGKRTHKWQENGGIMATVTGMFDSKGNTHSFVDEGINCICKSESGNESLTGSGWKHTGLYSHGDRHGEGVLTEPGGFLSVKGVWKNDKLTGPVEIQMYATTYKLVRVSIFADYQEGKLLHGICKIVFHDDNRIYVGECGHRMYWEFPGLNGHGILLDDKGIHVGMWCCGEMTGIEQHYLCDDAGTVVELEHTLRNNQSREVSRSIGNPLFRVPHDDTSLLAELQRLELAKFVGKRRTMTQFQIHLHVEGGQNGDFCLDTTLERRPLLKDVRVFSNSL